MNNLSRDRSPASLAAQNARAIDVQSILQRPNLCAQLKEAFRQRKTYKQILDRLGGPAGIGLKSDLKTATVKYVLREVKHLVVDTVTSKKHANACHASAARENASAIGEGRREWMMSQNFFVWSTEEDEFFREQLDKPEMLRPGKGRRLNHKKLAAAMNQHFGTDRFTPEETRKHKEDTNKVQQAAKRERIRQRKLSVAESPETRGERVTFTTSPIMTEEGEEGVEEGTF